MRRIFISFRETEREHREAFEGILQNPNSPLRGIPISSREDVRHEGEEAIRIYIREMLNESDLMLCLIGNDSHNSRWIDYELNVATSKQKPIIGVKIPDTTGAGPELFLKRNLPIVEWNTRRIQSAIDRIHH